MLFAENESTISSAVRGCGHPGVGKDNKKTTADAEHPGEVGVTVVLMDWSKARILFVHSDIHVRRWAHDVFHKQKVGSVQSTRSAATGYDLLARFRADVAIVQLAQSEMTGAEFARRIRDGVRSPDPNLPVVLIVDTPHPELLREACDAGIEGVIARPTTPEAFMTRIANAIRDPRRFVSSESYFGPCRRRETPANYPGPFRREEDPEEKKTPAKPAQTAKPAAPAKPPAAARKKARDWDDGDLTAAEVRKPVRADSPVEVKAAKPAGGKISDVREAAARSAKAHTENWHAALSADEKPAKPEDSGPDIEAILADHALWLRSTGEDGMKAQFNKADLAGRSLAEANLTNAALREADLSDSDCRNATLASADLRRSDLSAADLNGTDLSVANLRGASLKLARFGETSLRGADLAGASFAGTAVADTDFASANLLDTDFTGADLSRAKGLIQRQIDKARIDGKTTLPPGLRRPDA